MSVVKGPRRVDLVYFGSGAFGLPTLASLVSEHRVVAVVTQPDRPAGRGGKATPTPVAAWMAAHAPGVALHRPEKVNEAGVATMLRGLGARGWVAIAYGQKLGRGLLEGVPAVNLHASLLPRWRGAAPIHAAILAGDSATGNSIFYLVDRMDAGPVLVRRATEIGASETAGELHDRLAAAGPEAMREALRRVEAGERGEVQDETLATLAPKLRREDAWIDFSRPGVECARRINAMSPWPGIGARIGGVECKLLRAAPEADGAVTGPGAVLDGREGIVECGAGTRLRLLEVQRAGGKPMKWGEFARGARVAQGALVAGMLPSC